MGARKGGGGPQDAAVEPAIDKLDVGVVDEDGPERALPVGVLDEQVCRSLPVFCYGKEKQCTDIASKASVGDFPARW